MSVSKPTIRAGPSILPKRPSANFEFGLLHPKSMAFWRNLKKVNE